MAKSKSTPAKPVSAARVREAARNGEFTVTDEMRPSLFGGTYSKTKGYTPSETGLVRGRLLPAAAEAFNAEVEGEVYAGEKSNVDEGTVEVPQWSQKTGRPVKAKTLPRSEVRALAGTAGKAGRISKADLLAAAKALGAGPKE